MRSHIEILNKEGQMLPKETAYLRLCRIQGFGTWKDSERPSYASGFHSVLHVAPKFHRGALGAPVEGE